MALNHVSVGQAAIPAPLTAQYPDGGADVIEYSIDNPGFAITAHPEGVFRVWRVEHRIGDWPYYPIRAVGMTEEEIARAIAVACQMLALPHNRSAKRARASVH